MEEQISYSLSVLKLPGNTIHPSDCQTNAITSILEGRDTIVCLPTGHGKSLIFQCIPWCRKFNKGLRTKDKEPTYSVLVVSPLISLMNEQVEYLQKRGLSAVRLQSGLDKDSEDELLSGRVTYIFGSPESLEERKWRSMLLSEVYQKYLAAVFVDEAHCIDLWGGGKVPFRRAYRSICELRSFLPDIVPFVALTATATINTRREISSSLGMTKPITISTSPNRNNIMFLVQTVSNDIAMVFEWIVRELLQHGKKTTKTVVFCKSIDVCSQLYCHFDVTLKERGYVGANISVKYCLFAMYHAKITDVEKRTILQSFQNVNGHCRVLFATIAFGMGINIPDIHRVIHFGPSRDIEEYVQESGRGGRDGTQCYAMLYIFSGCTRGNISEEMKAYCKNSDICRRKFLFQYFPGSYNGPHVLHDCCDVCQSLCQCACRCCHCSCGNGYPCLNCCVCTTKCNFVQQPFPCKTTQCVRQDMDGDTYTADSEDLHLTWNEKEAYFSH